MIQSPLRHCLSLVVPILLSTQISMAQEASAIVEALTDGKGHLSFRYRLENVDQDRFPKVAHASTLKTRLNYKSGSVGGFSIFLEVDDLSYIGASDFNNTRNDKVTYPVVADPKGTDINQAYLAYQGMHTTLKFGRQRIDLDGQRFLGGVAWRQNEQTYDAVSIENGSISPHDCILCLRQQGTKDLRSR